MRAGDVALPGQGSVRSAGDRVRRAGRDRGLTLEAAAGRVGKSKGWLSMTETGHLQLDRLSGIIALAGVLGVPVPVPVLIGVPCPGCPRSAGGGGGGR